VGLPTDYRYIAISLRPERKDFVQRPDRHRAGNGPKEVVQHLVIEEEVRIVGGGPTAIVLIVRPLSPPHIEPQVPGADEQHDQRQIAEKDGRDPTDAKRLQLRKVGRQEQPRQQRDACIECIPRPQITGKAE